MHQRPSLAPTVFSLLFTLFFQSLTQRVRDAGSVMSPNTAPLNGTTAGNRVVNARSCESGKSRCERQAIGNHVLRDRISQR